eukprot:TRINITY_DN48366_c0_g1_i2.p1 TRINITY_DN48366_c0_g1~~TRINITY_DN48366_c0_g1_i2.p1  ORF type:complete len:170 (-),score=20.96 TRINITY_DN48366_c0_g1_i2:33-542(-)
MENLMSIQMPLQHTPPKPPISPGKHVESGRVSKRIPHAHSSHGEERKKPAVIVDDDDDVQEDGKAKKQQKNKLQRMSCFYSLFSCASEVPNQCLVHFIVPFCIRFLKQLYSLFHIFHIFLWVRFSCIWNNSFEFSTLVTMGQTITSVQDIEPDNGRILLYFVVQFDHSI